MMLEHKYSPDQVRDDHGRFGAGGSQLGTGEAFSHGTPAQGGIELHRDQTGKLHWHTPATNRSGGPHESIEAVVADAQDHSGLAIPDQPFSRATVEAARASRNQRTGKSAMSETELKVGRADYAISPFEFKFTDGIGKPAGTFEGYTAIFNNIDDGGDRILPGAFVRTLAESKASNAMPKMLLNHGGMQNMFGATPTDLLPIGKWHEMAEDSKGLAVHGRLINLDTESGKRIYGAMKEGELNSLSIAYKSLKFTRGTRAGEPKRTLSEVKLIEAGPVTFPMNGLAAIAAVKSSGISTIREFEDFLRDVGGYSHAAAKAIAAGGFKASEPRDEDGADHAAMEIIRRNIATLNSQGT